MSEQLDDTQAIIGSIRTLLALASDSLDGASALAGLIDAVSAERIRTVRADVESCLKTWGSS